MTSLAGRGNPAGDRGAARKGKPSAPRHYPADPLRRLGPCDVIHGDALHLPLEDGTVDLIVTSPPYFALRSYSDDGAHYDGQIGSEPTPAEYVDALIAATREMARALKPSGSIWINLGDKYSGAQAQNFNGVSRAGGSAKTWAQTDPRRTGIPNKSLMGLPWRYALRCIDELGLILRAEVVWSKPNGLPESVTDRVRRSHEQWFHLVKHPRYYSAVDEIREAHLDTHTRVRTWDERKASGVPVVSGGDRGRHVGTPGEPNTRMAGSPLGKLPGSVREVPSQPLNVPDHLGVDHFAAFPVAWPLWIVQGWSPPSVCAACGEGRRPVSDVQYERRQNNLPGGRIERNRDKNRNDAALPYGSSALRLTTITGYVCACTPYTDHPGTGGSGKSYADDVAAGRYALSTDGAPRDTSHPGHAGLWDRPKVGPWREYHFDQWTPAPTTPAVVLDPFGGAGSTALAARSLGRHAITVDLSRDYCRLADWRVTDPGELARTRGVDKPPAVDNRQTSLFEDTP